MCCRIGQGCPSWTPPDLISSAVTEPSTSMPRTSGTLPPHQSCKWIFLPLIQVLQRKLRVSKHYCPITYRWSLRAQHRKWHQDLPKVRSLPGRSSFPFCVIGSVVTFHLLFLTQIEVTRIRMRLTTMISMLWRELLFFMNFFWRSIIQKDLQDNIYVLILLQHTLVECIKVYPT